jgi:iron complex transport system ATP-binding protein
VRALERTARPGGPTTLIATHHLEEIPPSTTHATLLRAGCVVAAGPIDEVLTSRNLERAFGLVVDVGRRAGRWWAAASPGADA